MSTPPPTPHPPPRPPPGIEHALNEAQRATLIALHGRLDRLLREAPLTAIQEIRPRGLNLLLVSIDAATDYNGRMTRGYCNRLFNYGLQGLRRVALAVQTHFDVPATDIRFARWEVFQGRRPRPPDDASVKDRWRWAIAWNLDMTSNTSLCLGAASSVLKDCTLRGPTNVAFQTEEDFPCPAVEEYDQAWRDELRGFAGHALFALAQLLKARFGGRSVGVLGWETG